MGFAHERSSRGRQIKVSFNAIKPPFDAIESTFDPAETLIDAIETSALDGNLRLHVTHLGHDVPKCSFKSGDAGLEICDIGTHLVLPTPNEVQLLHDQIDGFVGHVLNLVRLTCQIHAYHNASAPEMISISYLVIIAWRVRL
jgi:hypothetical protein